MTSPSVSTSNRIKSPPSTKQPPHRLPFEGAVILADFKWNITHSNRITQIKTKSEANKWITVTATTVGEILASTTLVITLVCLKMMAENRRWKIIMVTVNTLTIR